MWMFAALSKALFSYTPGRQTSAWRHSIKPYAAKPIALCCVSAWLSACSLTLGPVEYPHIRQAGVPNLEARILPTSLEGTLLGQELDNIGQPIRAYQRADDIKKPFDYTYIKIPLRIVVGTSGNVISATPDDPPYDNADHVLEALKIAKQLKFQPLIIDGVPFEYVGTLRLPVAHAPEYTDQAVAQILEDPSLKPSDIQITVMRTCCNYGFTKVVTGEGYIDTYPRFYGLKLLDIYEGPDDEEAEQRHFQQDNFRDIINKLRDDYGSNTSQKYTNKKDLIELLKTINHYGFFKEKSYDFTSDDTQEIVTVSNIIIKNIQYTVKEENAVPYYESINGFINKLLDKYTYPYEYSPEFSAQERDISSYAAASQALDIMFDYPADSTQSILLDMLKNGLDIYSRPILSEEENYKCRQLSSAHENTEDEDEDEDELYDLCYRFEESPTLGKLLFDHALVNTDINLISLLIELHSKEELQDFASTYSIRNYFRCAVDFTKFIFENKKYVLGPNNHYWRIGTSFGTISIKEATLEDSFLIKALDCSPQEQQQLAEIYNKYLNGAQKIQSTSWESMTPEFYSSLLKLVRNLPDKVRADRDEKLKGVEQYAYSHMHSDVVRYLYLKHRGWRLSKVTLGQFLSITDAKEMPASHAWLSARLNKTQAQTERAEP